MTPNKPIAKLPESPSWNQLHWLVEELLKDIQSERTNAFGLSFLLERYNPPPYIQGQMGGAGEFQIEIVGDYFLEPDLTVSQKSSLNQTGWASPREGFPNYRKMISPKLALDSASIYLVTSMRMVFSLKGCWMTMGNTTRSKALISKGGFDVHRNDTFVFKISED